MTLRSETLDYKSVNMEHFIYKETFFFGVYGLVSRPLGHFKETILHMIQIIYQIYKFTFKYIL